jgi:hypothetical protein
MIDTDYLQTVPILRLQAAARQAGLAFRNGDLNKAGIIDRLSRHPLIGGATIAMLKREDFRRKPDPADWLDADEAPSPKTELVSPAPPPVSIPSSESFGGWRPAVTQVAQSVRDLSRTVTRKSESLENLIHHQGQRVADTEKAIEALQQQRPIEVRIAERPPVRIEGRTHKQFPDLLAWLSAIKRVILTGPAGTGKSRAALQCAEALGLDFHLQTPFTQSYEYLGHRDAQGAFHESPTFKAYTRGGVLLMDEADSSAPDAFLAANPILDGNGFAMFGDGVLHKQHPDFYVILNMNTMGDGASMAYSGRNPLDGATIARFGGMLPWEVDAQMESAMAQGEGQFYAAVTAVRVLMAQHGILTVNATPRHTLIGSTLLKTDAFKSRREFILSACLKNGALADIWPDVLRLPAVQAFIRG